MAVKKNALQCGWQITWKPTLLSRSVSLFWNCISVACSLLDVQRELSVCSHDIKLHLDEPMCVCECWIWQLRGWLLKYHGQRLFEAVGDLLMGKLLPGGAGYVPELLVRCGSQQKIQVPKSFTCLLCERFPHSSHACSMLWCWTSWKWNWFSLFYFTATYRTIFFPESHHCFLRGNCTIVKKYILGLFCWVFASVFV